MNRKSKFITTIVVTMTTFGTLMATIGPKKFGNRNCHNQTEHYDKPDYRQSEHHKFEHQNENRNNNN